MDEENEEDVEEFFEKRIRAVGYTQALKDKKHLLDELQKIETMFLDKKFAFLLVLCNKNNLLTSEHLEYIDKLRQDKIWDDYFTEAEIEIDNSARSGG